MKETSMFINRILCQDFISRSKRYLIGASRTTEKWLAILMFVYRQGRNHSGGIAYTIVGRIYYLYYKIKLFNIIFTEKPVYYYFFFV